MYLDILKYLGFIALLAYLIMLLKDELHIMQLNSYFNSRYSKWLKENLITRFGKIKLVIIALALAFCFYPAWFTAIALTATSIAGTYELIKRKAKKKLDFTPRAKRLFSIEILVTLIPAILVFWVSGKIEYAAAVLVAVALLSFVNILISNLIASPFEKMINRWYVNDARKKIRAHTSLIKIAVTGSFGKTSVKHFLEKILSEKYNVLITPGSYNTTMGVVRTIREYLQPKHEVFIIEMGAKKKGDIKEICDLTDPHYGIVTSVGPQHLETFGSLENVMATKLEIIAGLSSEGTGYVNSDNVSPQNIPAGTKAKITTFGITSDAEFSAKNIAYKGIGMTFDVQRKGETVLSVETRLLGEHNVSNLLACCAVALDMKVEKYRIEKAVKGIEAVSHRLEVKKLANGVTIIDDAFNSNPVGSKMALEALKRFEGKRKIVITPGMIELGAQEYELNFNFGKSIAANCDFAVLVGMNRTKPIQEGIKSTAFPLANLFVCKNLQEANDTVKKIMQAGDVVLYENDLPDTFNE